MKLIFNCFFAFFIVYLLLCFWLYVSQRSMMYHPIKEAKPLAEFNLVGTEEITLITKDKVKLEAWYKKPSSNNKMAIVLHGNSGNITDRAHLLKELISLGYGFLIPAWRGFGKSEGNPNKEGLYLDAEAAIDFVQSKRIPLENTIIIGESLGTGIATEMATKYKFKGIFLITPYKSISERADELYPFMMAKYLTKDNFSVIDKIDQINQPLFIIHCTNDKVVPYSHAKQVYLKAKEPKQLLTYQGCGHINYGAKDAFMQMDSFLYK